MKKVIFLWTWKINMIFLKKLIKNAVLTPNVLKRYANKPLLACNLQRDYQGIHHGAQQQSG